MKTSLFRPFAAIAASISLLAGSAIADPWPPVAGDLILGFQATSGQGANTNLFFNLGPAFEYRDNGDNGVVVNIAQELEDTFGNDWFERTDLYFGAIANFSASSVGPVTNGDPTRTFYLSRTASAPGGSSTWTGFSSAALGSAGTKLSGQYGMFAGLVTSPNEVGILPSSDTVRWANGWSTWNPVPGPAFDTFTGGVQNNFGKAPGQIPMVDLQRVTPSVAGTYETTIAIASNGDVIVATGFFNLEATAPTGGSVTGIAPGGETVPAGTVRNVSATANTGFTFTGWVVNGAPAGSTNPLPLTVTLDTTVEALFAKDVSDTDTDGISAHDELTIHNTDPGVANTPPAFPSGTSHLGTLGFGALAPNEAGTEISAFDPASERLFVVSGVGLRVIDLSDPTAPTLITTIDLSAAPFNAVSNDLTSVDVFDGTVAVSVVNANKEVAGSVVFLSAATAGVGTGHLSTVTVGHHPDMVTFTPDGSKLLVANEGEYISGGPGVTPGSVSIVDVSGGFGSPTVNTVGFTAFDGQVATLKSVGVRIFGAELPSNDLEPEYIAVSPDGATAFVTLQENNAVAILNIATATFTNILPLGLKDFSTLLVDFSDRDNAAGTGAMGVLTTGNPVFGLYMPDAIASFQSGGQTYYVMANEGDDRDDFLAPDETARVSTLDLDDTTFPTETTLKQNRNLGRFTVTTNGEDGDPLGSPVDQLLALGGRSFSILDASGAMVYDSDDFIEKTIHSYGTPFHDDSRSDNKASEPEGATVGVVNGRTLAFIGLERANGVMVFDVTDVNTPTFVSFLHHAGDVSPEGLTFVPAPDSPNNKALLIVTNEVSNTVTVYGFDETTYNLTVTPPTNGTVQGGGVFVENDTTQLLAVPATGYAFTGWTGDASGTVNPLDVLMDADKTIGATFGPDATDTDGNKFSAFEEVNLAAIPLRYFIGDTVDIDLSFLSTTTGQSILVTGLPKGLVFSPTTKRITGKVLTMLGEIPVEIRKVTGKALNGSILFNMSVSPYPFVGNYVGLLEKPDATPDGFFKLFVTGPGVYTANLTLAGQGIRTMKGVFTDTPGNAQRTLAITFPAGKGGVPAATTVNVTLDSAATSDAITGNRDGVGVNTLRGFRLAKVGRTPAAIRNINVALVNTVPGNGVAVPGGTGYLSGTVDTKGLVRVTGFTGDGKAVAGAFDLSQTNQTVVWLQPYLDKRSYLGGVVTIGDLGLPGRGGSGTAPLAEGIKWFKQADARELSYPAGFAVQQIDPQTSQWILPPTSVAMGDSLGLAFNEINVSYHNPLGVVNLPTKFRLTERFGLLRIAPNTSVLWSRGVALNKTGNFTGILTLPNGAGVVNGVLLQDASFGTKVGAGLVRVPLPLTVVPRGSFQTIGIDLAQ